MYSTSSDHTEATDVLDEYVSRIDELHTKVERIVHAQHDICSSLQRTADALRTLAQVTHN